MNTKGAIQSQKEISASFKFLFKFDFSPLFDTPSASRTILTSQTSQYSNTAVTGSPKITPSIGPLDRNVNRNHLLSPVGRTRGEPEEGNDTQESHNIDTFTQLNTLSM